MKKKYTNYSNKFKFKVVLEVLKNEKTLNEISSDFQVPKKNVQNWKNQFLQNGEIVFNKEKAVAEYKHKLESGQKEKDNLHRKIGQLTIENEWAKKKIEELGL
jgi:transposase-like protein